MKSRQRAESPSCVDGSSWITLRVGPRHSLLSRAPRARRMARVASHEVNGRIGSRLGRSRSHEAASIEVALLELAAIARAPRLRGYELTP